MPSTPPGPNCPAALSSSVRRRPWVTNSRLRIPAGSIWGTSNFCAERPKSTTVSPSAGGAAPGSREFMGGRNQLSITRTFGADAVLSARPR